jgi:hypothetical protein
VISSSPSTTAQMHLFASEEPKNADVHAPQIYSREKSEKFKTSSGRKINARAMFSIQKLMLLENK